LGEEFGGTGISEKTRVCSELDLGVNTGSLKKMFNAITNNGNATESSGTQERPNSEAIKPES
jgi:hypothetical protein